MIELSVILPAYREAENLRSLLPLLQETVRPWGVSHEFIVVDAQTPLDDTPEICRNLGVRCLPRTGGNNYADAVRTAIPASRGQYVIFMDADGSHPPRFLPELWQRRQEADLIIASRYVPGGQTENPRILIFLSLVVNVMFRVVLGLPCRDVSNSFRLYRGEHLRQLHLQCQHFDIIEEILVLLCVLHPRYRILEVPVTFARRQAGTTKRRLLAFACGYVMVLWRLFRVKRRARAQTAEAP